MHVWLLVQKKQIYDFCTKKAAIKGVFTVTIGHLSLYIIKEASFVAHNSHPNTSTYLRKKIEAKCNRENVTINQSIKTWIYIAPLKQKFTEAPVTSRHAQKATT